MFIYDYTPISFIYGPISKELYLPFRLIDTSLANNYRLLDSDYTSLANDHIPIVASVLEWANSVL